MRVSRVIFWFVFCLSLPGQISSLFGQSVTSLIHDVSNVADGSVTQARLEAQRQAMGAGPAYRSSEKDDFRSFSGRYTPPELPEDKKGRFVYGLALFSDDGCNVTADSSPIHQRLGQAQHLPDIGASFQVLQTVLAPGEPIDITVNYSNIIYNDDPDSPDYPDIDGCTLFLYLIPAAIAVDANRDGTIAFSGEARDTTSQDAPFRFWCNDDNDGLPNSEGEVVGPSSPDHEDGMIQTARDLEDFTRLWLKFDAFQKEISEGTYRIGLKWKTTGSPSIKLYRSTDTNGSDSYLKDEEAALKQISGKDTGAIGTVASETSLMLRMDLWSGSGDQEKLCLLFEGSQEGKGQLVLTIEKSDGTEIGEGPGVWLDLKNIKKMYQSSTNNIFEQPPDEAKQAILFVHGWNMSPDGSRNFAETMFKRIWHRGFKGRLAYFRWNTEWSDVFDNVPGVGQAAEAYFSSYNTSEYTAWTQAGPQLKAFAQQVPGDYTKNIAAHSMGNIVVGSALIEGMTVNNYALMQAAVPAACYDEREAIRQTQTATHTVKLNFWGTELPVGRVTVWDEESPDDDPDSITRNLAYRGMLKDIGQHCNPINFYLPADNATSYTWEINNDVTKPPGGMSANFRYRRENPNGEKLYKYNVNHNEIIDYYLSSRYEAVSLACRTWSKAVGAEARTEGAIPSANKVNVGNPTFQLPTESPGSGFGDEHSGQFNFTIQQLKPFYDTLMDELELPRNP